MRPPELETWFREYRDRHDGAALARVFDASAAKLLLIAQHLTRDASAAEDLVQTTFLTAIESARTWDDRQPLFPWLAGILANRARMQRRRARELPEPRSLRDRASEDPSEAAAAHEIDRALMAAIEALPATYREVLVLRLVHGLAGVEIAHALSRSPETVRTQLHRGLERLRAALPKGLLTPAILALLASDGLAAVRARVLAAALPSAAPAVVALAGTLTMKKLALAILPLALLGTWWALGPIGRSGSSAPSHEAAAVAAAATSKPASAERSDSAPERVAIPAARGEARALLRGRCVAAESGMAIADAEVYLQGCGREETNRKGHPDIRRWVRSGSDGSFELAFDPPSGHCFLIRIRVPQRATVGADWNSWRSDATLDLGDVALPLGTRLSGRVVDQEGKPIASASLQLSGPARLPCGNQPGADVHYSGPTKADGSFAYQDPLPSGTIRLRVGEGYVQLDECVLELLAGERTRDVTIVVRTPDPGAVLEGTVVDDLDRPIADVNVTATGNRSGGRYSARSDARGAFLVRCNGTPHEEARLSWYMRGGTQGYAAPAYRWGTKGIRLVALRQAASNGVRLLVVDAKTKAPFEDYGLTGALEPAKGINPDNQDHAAATPGHHELGEMRLTRLGSGLQTLIVLPQDPAHAPSDVVAFDPARQEDAPLRVEVDRPALLRVRVRAADGAAVAGTRVEAWRWLLTTQEAPWSSATLPLDMPESGSPVPSAAFRLAAATTDASGVATLGVTKSLQNLLVQALGPGHVRLARGGVASGEAGSEFELIVERGATLHGKVLPLGLVPRLDTTEPAPAVKPSDPTIPAPRGGMPANRRPGLSLVQIVEGGTRYVRLPTTPEPFPLADDGSFRIENVPPGAWQLCLFTFHLGTYGPEQPPLATLTLAEGSSQELTLDASQFLPCTISGRVLLDGKPLAGAGLTLFRAEPGGGDALLSTDDANPTAADGSFAQPHAKAGVHRLRAYVVDPLGRSELTYFSDDTLTIARGESKTWEVRLQSRRLELCILDADGKPLPSAGVRVGAAGSLFWRLLPTDRDGVAVLEPAPPIDLTITVRTPDCPDPEFWRLPPAEQKKRTVALGTHRVGLDRRVTRLELRLPPGVR